MRARYSVNDHQFTFSMIQASQQWKENTRDMSKQKVGSQLSAMNAATAQVVTLTSGGADETDYPAVGAAVQTM